MIRNIQGKKEINFLVVIFIIIAIIGVVIKSFEFYNIKIIYTTTADIYKHPLKVSNAALTIKQDIYKIDRDIKDILLSHSKEDISTLIEEVNAHERRVYETFSIIEQNILGVDGQRLEKKTKKLFKAWKPMRDEVISLVKNSKRDDAIAINRDKGANHVLKLDAATFELYAYAQNKAIGFKNKSESSFEILQRMNVAISLLFFLSFIFIGYYIIHIISKYISKNEHLDSVLSVILNINQLIAREKDAQLLIKESCNILVSTHIYSNAYIVTYDKNMNIEYLTSTDTSENFIKYKEKLNQGWISHCVDRTLNTNGLYSFIENTKNICIECPLACKYENRNAFNIALKYNERIYGYLTLSIDRIYLNENNERALLKEVAGDIAFALYNLENEKSLIKKEERYRRVIEATNDGLWDWNLVTSDVYYSPRWKSMLGYSDDELENSLEAWNKLVHPDDIKQVMIDIESSRENKTKQYKNIHRLKHKDGHWVWIESRGKTIYDEKSKPVRMIGSHIDISEQIKLQQELVETNKKLTNIAENIPGAIYTFQSFSDGRSCFPFASEHLYDIYGVTAKEVIEDATKVFGVLHPEDFNNVVKTIQTSFEELTLWRDEYRVVHPEKGIIWLKGIAKPEKQLDGSVLWYGYIHDITENKIAELEIHKAKTYYKTLLEYASDGVHILDLDGNLIAYSRSFAEHLGYEYDEVKTLNIRDWNLLVLQEQMGVIVKELLETPKIFETKHRKKDGTVVNVQINAKGIELDGVLCLYASSRDITQEKKIKENLIESEERFKNLVQQSPSSIEIYDLEGWMISLNHAAELLWDIKAENVLHKFNILESEEAKHTGLYQYIEKAYEGVVSELEPIEFNPSRTKANQGRKRCVKTTMYPLKDSNSKVNSIVVSHIDYTARQEAILLAAEKQRRFETIFNEAPNPIMLHNEDGKVLMVNKAWKTLSGYDFDEIDTIEKWTKNAYGKKMSVVKEQMDKLYELATTVNEGEYSINAKNGDIITWQFSSAALGIIDNKRTVISSGMDITQLKKKDEMLIAQSRLAAMGEMIGMIAHQWRQPLNIISMNANNMILDITLDELDILEVEEYSNNIQIQTENLSKTIDDFRNFFKPDKSIVKIKVQDIIKETYKIVKDGLRSNNIAFNTSYKSESEIDACPRELMQVFVSIINNSKDAIIQKKHKDAEIDVMVYEDDNYVITDICDNGGGIDMEILPKIFDPYFTTKDETTGTGLGLYMSKMIIDNHFDGNIEAYNQNEGVCFRVSLSK
ncbi:PAS domain S-box protein [Sulfurimonas sp. CS5]|uniref:PAS domain S-box protein n=1 Tax=Sulfurimonas sp. CS5 TaxID=3391145 RepID=UPI0039EBC14A